MADNLTDETERLVLDWLLTDAAVARPVLPLRMRLMQAEGTDSAAGTELVASEYTPKDITFSPASTTSGATKSRNAETVRYPLIDAGAEKTVTGVEIWDSGATPRRVVRGTFATPFIVPAGAPLEFAMNSLTFQIG